MDADTSLMMMPSALPLPLPQIDPRLQVASPQRTAVSWKYTLPSDASIARGDSADLAKPPAARAPYTSRKPAPVSNGRRPSLTAPFIRRALTVAGLRVGSIWIINAAVPETIGAAIEVPDNV